MHLNNKNHKSRNNRQFMQTVRWWCGGGAVGTARVGTASGWRLDGQVDNRIANGWEARKLRQNKRKHRITKKHKEKQQKTKKNKEHQKKHNEKQWKNKKIKEILKKKEQENKRKTK